MKLKLDENIGTNIAGLFQAAGFDAVTVNAQNMRGSLDNILIDCCRSEYRCLVTLDLGFANPITYPPQNYAGIAVIRLPKGQSMDDLMLSVSTLMIGLKKSDIAGQLWIVQNGRIRQYQPDDKSN